MLSKKEQLLVLEMYKRGTRQKAKIFTREELKSIGGIKTESGLSRAISNLYHHFSIDILKVGRPPVMTNSRVREIVSDRTVFDKMKRSDNIRKLPDGTEIKIFKEVVNEIPEDDLAICNMMKKGKDVHIICARRTKKDIEKSVEQRMKYLWKARRRYRETPKSQRQKYQLSEDGLKLGRNLEKARAWIDSDNQSK